MYCQIKIDIWSFGLTILHLSLGRNPITSLNSDKNKKDQNNHEEEERGFWNVMNRICHEKSPSPPSTIFSLEFQSFIDVCLRKDPKDRGSVVELLEHPFIKSSKNNKEWETDSDEEENDNDWLNEDMFQSDLKNVQNREKRSFTSPPLLMSSPASRLLSSSSSRKKNEENNNNNHSKEDLEKGDDDLLPLPLFSSSSNVDISQDKDLVPLKDLKDFKSLGKDCDLKSRLNDDRKEDKRYFEEDQKEEEEENECYLRELDQILVSLLDHSIQMKKLDLLDVEDFLQSRHNHEKNEEKEEEDEIMSQMREIHNQMRDEIVLMESSFQDFVSFVNSSSQDINPYLIFNSSTTSSTSDLSSRVPSWFVILEDLVFEFGLPLISSQSSIWEELGNQIGLKNEILKETLENRGWWF